MTMTTWTMDRFIEDLTKKPQPPPLPQAKSTQPPPTTTTMLLLPAALATLVPVLPLLQLERKVVGGTFSLYA